MNDKSWREVVELAEHYKAIGQQRVYLMGRDADMPWSFVSRLSEGGTHRLGTSVSVSFEADHPCGITFTWSFDLESRSANGSGNFKIDGGVPLGRRHARRTIQGRGVGATP